MDKSIITVCLIVCSFIVSGQDQKSLIAKGDKHYSSKEYKRALEAYLAAQEMNPDDAYLNFKIGLTYLYSETKSKAATYIDKAYRLNPAVNPDIDYHLGIAFQNTNSFQKAIEHFERFKKKNNKLASIANEKIAECQVADSLSQNELNVIIENLGAGVNTPYNDYSPIISADGNTLIFTSNRTDNPAKAKANANFEDIYVSYKSGNKWSEPKLISPNVNIKYNDAAASLSPDGKTLATGSGNDFDLAGKPVVNSAANVKSVDLMMKWAEKDKILPAEPSTNQAVARLGNHGAFVSCVSHYTNGLKKDGTISGAQKGAIQSCAGGASIP